MVDLFVHTDQSQVIDIHSKNDTTELISYPVGAKILINKHMQNLGGSGFNAAVSFSRIGLKTGYIGKTGRDPNSELIMKGLKKEKISFLGARGKENGFSIILDSVEHDRTILTYRGSNSELKFTELTMSKLKTKWFFFTSMRDQSLHTMLKIAEHAWKNKIKIALNPSATMLDSYPKEAINLIRYADVLVLNKEEAESLVGNSTREVNIMKLMVYGPQIIAITDSKNGVVAYKDGYFYKILPHKNLQIVESTGAGDSFASTLVAGLMLKKPFDFCLKMAIINAESVICHHGAQNLLLHRKSLFEAVKKDKRKIEKRKA